MSGYGGAAETGIKVWYLTNHLGAFLMVVACVGLVAYIYKHFSNGNYKFSLKNGYDLFVITAIATMFSTGMWMEWPKIQIDRLEAKQELRKLQLEIEDKGLATPAGQREIKGEDTF